MRIGLFGGSFNPIHYGHLRGAEEVREAFRLDKIIFIPSGKHPLKGAYSVADFHRLNMV
ncbi:MAG: adenylyltransferase/cytidyltransferase family protein, partial [Thermodesulfovibrionaceae bacterium]